MSVFSKQEIHFLSTVAQVGYGNPFLKERVTLEKAALGREFVSGGEVWSASVTDPDAEPPNVTSIHKKLAGMMEALPARLAGAPELGDEELAAYEESVHYLLYQRYHAQFVAALLQCPRGSAVSGPTAAMLDGYRAVDPTIKRDPTIYLTVPCGFKGPGEIGAEIRTFLGSMRRCSSVPALWREATNFLKSSYIGLGTFGRTIRNRKERLGTSKIRS